MNLGRTIFSQITEHLPAYEFQKRVEDSPLPLPAIGFWVFGAPPESTSVVEPFYYPTKVLLTGVHVLTNLPLENPLRVHRLRRRLTQFGRTGDRPRANVSFLPDSEVRVRNFE
jgi:hypothetical protein